MLRCDLKLLTTLGQRVNFVQSNCAEIKYLFVEKRKCTVHVKFVGSMLYHLYDERINLYKIDLPQEETFGLADTNLCKI